MTCTVDGLDTEFLCTLSKIRCTNWGIWTVGDREVVWRLELACCYPVDTRSFHIDSWEMDETCEFSGREEGTIFGKSLGNPVVGYSLCPSEYEVSTLGTRVYREGCTCITSTTCTTCPDEYTYCIPIVIELGFGFSFFSFFFMMIMFFYIPRGKQCKKSNHHNKREEYHSYPLPIREDEYFCKIWQ